MRSSIIIAALALVIFAPSAPADDAAPPDQVILRSGDVLRGQVTRNEDGSITLHHAELGSLRLSAEQVDRIDLPPERASTPAALVEAEVKRRNDELEAAARRSDWKFFLSLAFSGTFNVNDEVTLRAGGGASKEDDSGSFAFTIEYYLRTLNSSNTDNNLLANALREWNFGESPWLLFAQGTYQYDEFQDWEHRISLYGGPGYRLIRTDAMQLVLRLGAGATYEVGSSEWTRQLLFAEDFTWRISPRQRVMLNAGIAPEVSDFSNYLLTVHAEYALAIGDKPKGLALTTGLRNIYDSKPEGDSERNDLRVYAGLRYDF